MNKTAKKSAGIDAGLLVPALVIAAVYGVFLSIKGLPGSAALTAKRVAYQDALAAAVDPAQVARLGAERDDLKKKVADKRSALDESRRTGESLARKQSKPQGRIDVVAEIEEILKRHRLEVTRVKAADAVTDAKMATSLHRAAGALVDAIQKSMPETARPPGSFVDPMELEARMEAQRMGAHAAGAAMAAKAPPLDLRDMEVRGEYHDMLEALWALSESNGESVVVSIGLERPEHLGKQRAPLLWRLVVHVQAGSGPSSPGMRAPIPVPAPIPSPARAKPERLVSDRIPPR